MICLIIEQEEMGRQHGLTVMVGPVTAHHSIV
jgi:hypothetical protein